MDSNTNNITKNLILEFLNNELFSSTNGENAEENLQKIKQGIQSVFDNVFNSNSQIFKNYLNQIINSVNSSDDTVKRQIWLGLKCLYSFQFDLTPTENDSPIFYFSILIETYAPEFQSLFKSLERNIIEQIDNEDSTFLDIIIDFCKVTGFSIGEFIPEPTSSVIEMSDDYTFEKIIKLFELLPISLEYDINVDIFVASISEKSLNEIFDSIFDNYNVLQNFFYSLIKKALRELINNKAHKPYIKFLFFLDNYGVHLIGSDDNSKNLLNKKQNEINGEIYYEDPDSLSMFLWLANKCEEDVKNFSLIIYTSVVGKDFL
ncbi:MAG: hypothetical protein KatS3mg085_124 [Candidatus Dojkabacteria bacterium]|nr:MAG: hypothetical protein KatS3mg085_124 [Candidatus Dojkabacteria bacterium]